MPKVAKASAPAIKIPLKTLVGLLGKRPKDPDVQSALAKAGKVTFKSDFVIAKDAGFDYSVDQPATAKGNEPKVLTGIFLFRDAAVAKKLGKPKDTYEDTDYWHPTKTLRMNCEFARGKLVEVYFGQPRDY